MKKRLLFILLTACLAACQLGLPHPPDPYLTLGTMEVPYKISTYSQEDSGRSIEADAADPEELTKGKEYPAVPAGSELKVHFDDRPSSIEAGIWANNEDHSKEVEDNKVMLPKKKGTYIYIIHAHWKEGEAVYAFRIETK